MVLDGYVEAKPLHRRVRGFRHAPGAFIVACQPRVLHILFHVFLGVVFYIHGDITTGLLGQGILDITMGFPERGILCSSKGITMGSLGQGIRR